MENTIHMYNRCARCKKELGVYRYGFSPTFCSQYCLTEYGNHNYNSPKKDIDKDA